MRNSQVNHIHYLSVPLPYTHQINMSFLVRGGPINESRLNQGVSHLIEHLCFRQLNGLSQKQIYDQFNSYGCIFRGCTYSDFLRFDITVSRQFLCQAFDLFIQLLQQHRWSADDIAREKSVVIKQIEHKYISIYEICNKRYLKGSGYEKNIMGTVETVRKLPPDVIHKYSDRLFQLGNVCCVMTGSFQDGDEKYILHRLESLQSNVGSTKAYDKNNVFLPNHFACRGVEDDHIIASNNELSQIVFMFDLPLEINEYAANLLCSILGQGDGSKLSMVLREEKALTDEVFTNIDYFQGFSRISIEFTTFNQDVPACLNLVLSELKQLKNQIDKHDFDTDICFYTHNQSFDYDDPRTLNFNLGYRHYILQKNEVLPEELQHCYERLSPRDLVQAARDIFIPQNMSLFVSNNHRLLKKRDLQHEMSLLRQSL